MDDTEFFANLPRKVVGAAALLRNARDAVLVVKPTYRSNWLLPGGTVEVGESPFRACRREVKEELGLSVELGRLLCVDHRLAEPPRPDMLLFTFDGGILGNDDIGRIRLPAHELSEYRFAAPDELPALVTGNILRRVRVALEQLTRGTAVYLEDLAVESKP